MYTTASPDQPILYVVQLHALEQMITQRKDHEMLFEPIAQVICCDGLCKDALVEDSTAEYGHSVRHGTQAMVFRMEVLYYSFDLQQQATIGAQCTGRCCSARSVLIAYAVYCKLAVSVGFARTDTGT